MNSYALAAVLVGFAILLWRYTHRVPNPSQLEPMTARWLHELRRQRDP